MIKKLFIVLLVAAAVAVCCIPYWASTMAEKAFANPNDPMSPEMVNKAINIKKMTYFFGEARLIAEKATIYFPDSKYMPDYMYSAAMCAEQDKRPDVAIIWYQRFVDKYPSHAWTDQAKRKLEVLKGMNEAQ